jgi:uncharacterized protein (DUF433 family)
VSKIQEERPGFLKRLMIGTKNQYIIKDEGILHGEPIIRGTRVSVRAIAELWRMGVTPEEILTHFPHLTLAQVFDALSYYADHQDAIHEIISQNAVPDDLTHPASHLDA